MTELVEQIITKFTRIKILITTFNFTKFEPATIEEFLNEYTKMHEYVRELYLHSQCIVDLHKEAREFYSSDEYFAKKEITAFSSIIGQLAIELKMMASSLNIKSFEVWNDKLVNLQYVTTNDKLRIDIARLKFCTKAISILFSPLLNQHDRIIKTMKESFYLIDKQSTLYL